MTSDNALTTRVADDKTITCSLCPHTCRLSKGKVGRCHARTVREGEVVAQNYGRVTSFALDPIEKKPLTAFYPRSTVLSIGSYGCNLTCPFCQNNSISCAGENDTQWNVFSPQDVIQYALNLRNRACIGIAYTYNEPLVGYEFVYDCSELAHAHGLFNVVVSNGFINEEPLKRIAGLIDAVNIDLKGFTEDFYKQVGGNLETVKRSIEILARTPSCHLELTTLIVPGMNDSLDEVEALAAWVASLDSSIVLHLSRFFPRYLMCGTSSTPRSTMLAAAEVASRHLGNVCLGNM